MVVKIEVIEGPRQGDQLLFFQGVRIGRTHGDVLVADSKMSALHARIEKDDRGSLVLIDQDSANGIRINGRRVKRVALLRGVTFYLGKSGFRVTEVDEQAIPPKLVTNEEALVVKLQEHLVAIEAQATKKTSPPTETVAVFRPALELEVIEGIQFGTVFTLGYGPRYFGADPLECELFEPICPPLAFALNQNQELGLFFSTTYPKLVRYNNQELTQTSVAPGDVIRIGQTALRIGFLK